MPVPVPAVRVVWGTLAHGPHASVHHRRPCRVGAERRRFPHYWPPWYCHHCTLGFYRDSRLKKSLTWPGKSWSNWKCQNAMFCNPETTINAQIALMYLSISIDHLLLNMSTSWKSSCVLWWHVSLCTTKCPCVLPWCWARLWDLHCRSVHNKHERSREGGRH